ncbi:MAG: protein phosphatase CheZ [Hyphomicrobiales bacterium]|nr:protein phosphatase CheZ [Hyphomicrobiales bacterium]
MPQHKELYDALEKVRRQDDLALVDILSLAEVSFQALKSTYETLDQLVFREFREIGDYIARSKSEIGQLQANDLHNRKIPEAGRELDAVVEATEEATTRIMECAETILATDATDLDSYTATVTENVMTIFEACSFQDITGQRIAKVVETLNHIEARVSRFANAIGATDIEGALTEEEAKREQRKKDLILHGPQHDGDGRNQDDIDALFS